MIRISGDLAIVEDTVDVFTDWFKSKEGKRGEGIYTRECGNNITAM